MDAEYSSQRRRLNKTKLKRFAIILGCLYLITMMVRIVMSQEQYKATQQADYVELEGQLEQIRTANEELERKIGFAETNAYIERVARDQLGYVKDGEIKFVAGGTAQQAPEQGDAESGQLDDAGGIAPDTNADGYLPGIPSDLLDDEGE